MGDYPNGLDRRTGNLIRRIARWGRWGPGFPRIARPRPMTLEEFRALTDDDVLGLRNVGPALAVTVRTVRDTWPDDDLIEALEFKRSRPAGSDMGVCNWVGEAVAHA